MPNANSLTLRCGKCGAVFEDIPWTPGAQCPKCSAPALAPVLKGDSDYARADRSAAYALEDIRFGRIAQWAGYVTPKQVQWALHQQKEMARLHQRVPDIGALLMREKLLTQAQFNAVLAARRTKPNSKEDMEFSAAALRLGCVKDTQVEECRRQQAEANQKGRDAVPLPLLFVEKRFAQEPQVQALLKTLERDGSGMLTRLGRLHEEGIGPRKSVSEQLFGSKDSQLRKARIVLVAAVIPLFIILGLLFVKGSAPTATVRCKACSAEGGDPADSKWPTKCPACSQKGRFPLAMCKDCGERFPVSSAIGYGIHCPKCKSTSYIMITNKNKEERKKAEDQIQMKKKGAPAKSSRGGV